jgi:hypothetical protein
MLSTIFLLFGVWIRKSFLRLLSVLLVHLSHYHKKRIKNRMGCRSVDNINKTIVVIVTFFEIHSPSIHNPVLLRFCNTQDTDWPWYIGCFWKDEIMTWRWEGLQTNCIRFCQALESQTWSHGQ